MKRYKVESFDRYDMEEAADGMWVMHDAAEAAIVAAVAAERKRCARVARYFGELYDQRLEGRGAIDALTVIEAGGDILGSFNGVPVIATSATLTTCRHHNTEDRHVGNDEWETVCADCGALVGYGAGA